MPACKRYSRALPRRVASLRRLYVNKIQLGPGAEVLAAALGRVAMPKLESLGLGAGPIGDKGMSVLAF